MKTAKKLLSLLLAALLLASCASAAFGAEAVRTCPEIYVHGFMGTSIYADKDDPNSDVIWPPDMNGILTDVKAALPSLLTSLLLRDWKGFGDTALDLVDPYFTPVFYGEGAEPVNNTAQLKLSGFSHHKQRNGNCPCGSCRLLLLYMNKAGVLITFWCDFCCRMEGKQ